MTFFLRVAFIGWVVVGAASRTLALDGPTDFTIDFPFAANAATPAWLAHPSLSGGTFATLDLPITSPDAAASLLVTVFYEEKTGGFLRISWQGNGNPLPDAGQLPGPGEVGASSMLCENFYEGIGMSNQRSLLISADTLKQAGTLHFQTGDGALGISRIKLEWLENSTGLNSAAIKDVLVTTANGRTQLASDLGGLPPASADPAWEDRIVSVPVTDVPLRIEQGVDFTVHMDGVPARARLAVKEAGLPWGQHLVVWLNNKRAGIVFPETPALRDSGFQSRSPDAPYVGWREGTFLVPLSHLVSGDNVLEFSTEPDEVLPSSVVSSSPAVPLAVKDLSLELDYPAAANVGSSANTSGGSNSISDPAPADALQDTMSTTAPIPVSATVPANKIVP